jgi:hypothetical protein
MTMVEDELRVVYGAVYAAAAPPAVDRAEAVAARIKHHQRVRAAVGTTIVAIMLIATAGIAFATTRTAHPLPVATHKPNNDGLTTAAPGHLPAYAHGGKLVTYDTGTFANQSTLNVTFTPTDWNFEIGFACAAKDTSLELVVKINGHAREGTGCDGGTVVGAPSDPNAWEALGARLGRPLTISTILARGDLPTSPQATNVGTGTMSVGIYQAVPWDAYPFPSRPKDFEPLTKALLDLPVKLSDWVAYGPVDHSEPVTLPAQIETSIDSDSPGRYLIYFNRTQIGECETYDWGGGCVGSIDDVGKGDLAAFHVGQRVKVRVIGAPNDPHGQWHFQLAGS